jgi:hypothetical protein
MRFIFVLVFAMMANAADTREAEVMAASNSFDKCWDSRDVACLSKATTEDFILISRRADIRERAAFLEGMKSGSYSQTAGSAKIRDQKVRFYGNTAIQTRVENTPTPIGPRGAQNQPVVAADHFQTLVWVNIDGKGWRLATMHVSLPQLTPPTR